LKKWYSKASGIAGGLRGNYIAYWSDAGAGAAEREELIKGGRVTREDV